MTNKVRAAGAELEQLHVEEAAAQKEVAELVVSGGVCARGRAVCVCV